MIRQADENRRITTAPSLASIAYHKTSWLRESKKKDFWITPEVQKNPRQRATLPWSSPTVPSPQRLFTAVFGMGTGVTSLQSHREKI